jgi:hypothetical protein
MRSVRRIDDRTVEVTLKTNGKVLNTIRSVLSPDGKTRTDTLVGTNGQGQTIKNVMVRVKS